MSETRIGHVTGIDIVTVVIALLFLFLWPGPLRYEYRGADSQTRIDRWSHELRVYDVSTGEWIRPKATAAQR